MNKVILSREKLVDEYVTQGKTMREIADANSLSVGSVYNYLKRYGIQTRPSMTEKTKERIRVSLIGKPSPRKGVKLSQETRSRMSRAKIGVYAKPSEFGGHRKKRSDGYVAVFVPTHPRANKDGYVMEHDLVMEKEIGRYLNDGEVVHHINRQRDDNCISNLKLMTASSHMSFHAKERWQAKKAQEKERAL